MNTTIETTRQLAFDGPFGWLVIVPGFIVLLLIVFWSLLRERKVIGKGLFWLFGCLRLLSLVAVCWMLMAPDTVTTRRTTVRKTMVIAADVSGSMQTVDQPDSADDLRWTLSINQEETDSAIVAADRAEVAIRQASRLLNHVQRDSESSAVSAESDTRLSEAIRALDRGKRHLQILAKESRDPRMARELVRVLDDACFEQLRRLTPTTSLESSIQLTATSSLSGTAPPTSAWRDNLNDGAFLLDSVRRRAEELAKQTLGERKELISLKHRDSLTKLRREPRMSRVGQAIESLAEQQDSNVAIHQPATEQLIAPLIQFCTFDSNASPLSGSIQLDTNVGPKSELRPNQTTDLNQTLREIHRVNRDGQLAAVILYTDSLHNTGQSLDDVSRLFSGTPIHVVPIGSPKHVRDLMVQAVLAPSVMMQDDTVVIEVDIQAHDANGESCVVELVQDEQTIGHQSVKLSGDVSAARLRFDVQLADLGRHEFIARIVPIPGERSIDNNSKTFEVTVTRSKIGVLLSDELPRWEYRYLAQLFRRDTKIQCDELLFQPRMIATGDREQSQSFPQTVEQWARYDTVILGDVDSKRIRPESQQTLIESIRTRGGTLFLIAGSESMPAGFLNQPLAEIVPVTLNDRGAASIEGFSLSVTADGFRHHALMIGEDTASTQMAWDFVNRNAPVGWLSPYRFPRPTAQTLISAETRSRAADRRAADRRAAEQRDQAFLCWQPLGRGRVVYLAGPETYRLRYLRGDRYHYRLWGQLLRWAIASELSQANQLVKLKTDKTRYEEHESVEFDVELIDADHLPVESAEVTVIAESMNLDQPKTFSIDLHEDESISGRYTGHLQQIPPGEYRWSVKSDAAAQLLGDELAAPQSRFLVRPFVSKEMIDTRCDLVTAYRIADATGGHVLPPTAVSEILALSDLRPIVSEITERTPLWIRWEILILMVACLSTEWIIRKSKGYT